MLHVPWYMVFALGSDCLAYLLCFQSLYDLKFEFLSEVCSHEHYIPLCLPIMRKGMIKSFKGEWLYLISVLQDKEFFSAVWLSEDALSDILGVFYLVILRTLLLLLKCVWLLKNMFMCIVFYVSVWINRIKFSYAVFRFHW